MKRTARGTMLCLSACIAAVALVHPRSQARAEPKLERVLLVPSDKGVRAWAISRDKHGPILLHHDGRAWREEPGVRPLFIAPSPAGSPWVWDGAGVSQLTARGWSRIGVLPARRVAYRIKAMWGSSASDLWLIEEGMPPLHWDGRAWSPVANGWSDELRTLFVPEVAWGPGPAELWIAGSWRVESLDDQTHIDDHLVHWNGARFGRVSGGLRAARPGERADIRAMWGATAADVWAVGSSTGRSGTRSLALHLESGRWRPMQTSSAIPLFGIYGTSSDEVWMFGAASATGVPLLLGWQGALKRWPIETPIAAMTRDRSGTIWQASPTGRIDRLVLPAQGTTGD